MMDEMGATFLDALAKAATDRLGQDQPCASAARFAASSPDPDAAGTLRARFETLPPEDVSAILAQVHRTLREDGRGILAS
jgi:hypothetical protein